MVVHMWIRKQWGDKSMVDVWRKKVFPILNDSRGLICLQESVIREGLDYELVLFFELHH